MWPVQQRFELRLKERTLLKLRKRGKRKVAGCFRHWETRHAKKVREEKKGSRRGVFVQEKDIPLKKYASLKVKLLRDS